MVMAFLRTLIFLGFLAVVSAVPRRVFRQSITTLSQAQIEAFTPYTWYASTASCDPSTTLTWSCGANCEANPEFVPTASGGNGASVQYWFVGYDPSLKTVIVSHQGTDPSKILPLITDASVSLSSLSSSLFPGVPSDVKVHAGFKESQEDTASDILAAVQKTLSANSASKVAVVGWSLGAAISLLDALYLHLQIPSATVSYVGYGSPRVGSDSFADYIDSELSGKVTRINNKEDIVPILPGRFLGFAHVSGENHIKEDDSWVTCPGQDNTDSQCSTGDVSNVLDGEAGDHDGPYNGITLEC